MSASIENQMNEHISIETPQLIVLDDDDAQLRIHLRRISRDLPNLSVVTTSSPDYALDTIIERLPQPTLLVTDLDMPGLDGFAMCRILKNTSVPVVLVSGELSAEREIQAQRNGALACFRKPFDIVELVQQVGLVERAFDPSSLITAHGPATPFS